MDFDISKALLAVYEEQANHPVTDDERSEILKQIRSLHLLDPCNSAYNNPWIISNYQTTDPQLIEYEAQHKLDTFAHYIRCLVCDWMDCVEDPTPYTLKRNMVKVKESHLAILLLHERDLDFYDKVVRHSYRDMFRCEPYLCDDIEGYKRFFNEYTKDPESFKPCQIKAYMTPDHIAAVDPSLFEMPIIPAIPSTPPPIPNANCVDSICPPPIP